MKRIGKEIAGPLVIAALVILIMRSALFSSGELVPTLPATDLHRYFLGWRYFGFTQWLHGHFPYWNPCVFCGIPFFAQFQANLLYPITWINFLCNAATGTTIELAAHVWIAGVCTYTWARLRGISRSGATLAGIAFAFSAPVYLRVLAGHLSPLFSLAWTPLIFLAVDLILKPKWLGGVLIGGIAVCLQLLGGYPQYCYFALLVAGCYLLLESIGRTHVLRMYIGFAAMYVLGAMLAGAQIIPGLLATELSVRSGSVTYQFLASFSLPLENLLTIFLPYPYGDTVHIAYAGRWYPWEMSIYGGIIVLALAGAAFVYMSPRRRWRMAALLLITLMLTTSYYIGIHWWLYRFLPGFAMFRGTSKFGAMWILLLAILSAEGWDAARQNTRRAVAGWVLILGMICLSLAAIFAKTSLETALLTHIYRSHEFFHESVFHQPHFIETMRRLMTWQWCIAGLLLLVAAGLLYVRRWYAWAPYALLLLASGEVYIAACISASTVPARIFYPQSWFSAIDHAIAADQRVFYAEEQYSNSGYLLGADSIWGYDPAQPARYTDLIAASQNEENNIGAGYSARFQKISRMFQLLRCRYVLITQMNPQVIETPPPMAHVQLLGSYVQMSDPKAMAAALAKDFDFRHSAILETEPNPLPTLTGATGTARLLRQSINDLEIEATLPAPALLLVTDAYAPGWHVRTIDPNATQPTYQILRGDDVLRVIPLAAGHHHFDLYYTPPGLEAGIAISLAGFALLSAGCWRITRPRRTPSA